MKAIKKITALSMAALLALGASAFSAGAEEADGGKTAIVSIEAFSIGNGYVVKPTEVSFTEGENVAAVVDRALRKNNIAYEATGTIEENFYLKNISFKNTDNIPSYIKNAVVAYDEETGEETLFGDYIEEGSPDSLGSNDYCSYLSGWMYTVNNPTSDSLSLGMSQANLNDGDVIRVQFSLDCGADIGIADLSGMPDWGFHSDFYPVADKTELTRAIAKAQPEASTPQYNALEKMIGVAAYLPAAQSEVDGELDAYNYLVSTGVSLGDIDESNGVSVSDAIMAQKYIAGIIDLDSARQSIADCTCDGKISVSDVILMQKSVANITAL